MRVVDAGVIVDLLLRGLDPDRLGDEALAAPRLLDTEVLHVLRRLVLRGGLSDAEGDAALQAFMALELLRFPADGLRPRMWELRSNLSAYDATYVALAEGIGASALLTTDARLARVPGIRCDVQLL